MKLLYFLLPNGSYIWGNEIPLQYLSVYKVIGCYVKFFGQFFVNYRNLNHTLLIKIIYLIITLTILYYSMHSLFTKKKYIQFVLLLMLPIIVSIISFIYYIKPTMMFANLSLYYLWLLFLHNYINNLKFIDNKNKVFILISLLSIILMFSHNMYKSIASYEYYLDIEKKNINFITRLATKIEMCEGYSVDSYIYLNVDGKHNPPLKDKIAYNIIDYFDNGMVGTTLQEIDWEYNLIYSMLKYFTGFNMKLANSDIINAIKGSKEYLDMGIYPDYNSIKCINGVIVVKLYSD